MNQAATPEVAQSIANEPGYAGRILIPGQGVFAIIAAPKATGEHEPVRWNKNAKRVDGAMSFFDGATNTEAMAKAGSKLAQWALDLGFYIPARDELELLYRAFKPTTEKNYCWRGDNPSSVPAGYAYMPDSPAQTAIEAYREGGAEAFADEWYWSSTQSAGLAASAWVQNFSYGYQYSGHKVDVYRARAVRRVLITSSI